ncbi:protein of unknown function [Pseudodesulfovibrio profundus]|uniref:Uncharacterized protein n=1 Tax=Pseudodesulfovibrio profundus TaxID=57320 RepID=A0A2C8FDE6_9BACT|nr:protein of unknown function [Pseudodesulfovibrio profundus]
MATRLLGGTNSDAGLHLKKTDQWSKGWGEAHSSYSEGAE